MLRTASRVFAEEGLDVSLGRIARGAGVGAGTVHRHFPSKELLVEAVLARHVDTLVAAADTWSARALPGDALFGFLLEVIERSTGRGPACEALTRDRGWPRSLLGAADQRFHQVLARLLHDARRAGAIRADVRIADLSAVLAGGVALRSAHRDRTRGSLLVRLLLDALRTPALRKPGAAEEAGPRTGDPEESVTKAGEFGDAPARPRHESAAARCCVECGTPLRVHPTGRPARYCGPACRQRAHRRRRA
ncbi:TetR family transcriptional regulator [Streptomyces sp. NPDC088789]|uniref:SbtR family transcriptional regulator n=1 Tax=Streptomyces sp. NPDC088789 TaxID=3365899 RepID=UPI0037F32ED4